MLKVELLNKIFDSASIQRWNDHLRPIPLSELDKQAHKIIISYLIAKMDHYERKKEVNWISLIECSIFEFLKNIVLTDIKRQVFSYLKKYERDGINNFVLEKYEDLLKELPNNFWDKFKNYLTNFNQNIYEREVLRAASNLTTFWEYMLIYNSNKDSHDTKTVIKNLKNKIENYYEFSIIERFMNKNKPFQFINLCGQLRFQKRWSQTPRIPETTILGHLLITALISYFLLNEIDVCDKLVYNTFFGSLFHDLPEALSRDIISPVKSQIPHIDELVKEYELMEIENKILPILHPIFHYEIKYFIIDEFTNKIIKNDKIIKTDNNISQFMKNYNKDKFNPLCGEIIKISDHLSAYIEAFMSIKCGIKSKHLEDGMEYLFKKYKDIKILKLNISDIYKKYYEEVH